MILHADFGHDPPAARTAFALKQLDFVGETRLNQSVLGARHRAPDDLAINQFDAFIRGLHQIRYGL
jgi:hypothetical protein